MESNGKSMISHLKLEDYLISEETAALIEGPVKTLEVIYWHLSDWKIDCTLALAYICRRLRVKILIFGRGDIFQHNSIGFFSRLKKYIPIKSECSFLPNLKEIEITYDKYRTPDFGGFLQNSNVYRLTWRSGPDDDFIRNHVDFFLVKLYSLDPNPFKGSYRLRELNFILPWDHKPIPFMLPARSVIPSWSGFRVCKENSYIEERLVKHRNGYQKCFSGTIIILSLRRQIRFKTHLHTLRIIGKMIWETKGTSIWCDGELG